MGSKKYFVGVFWGLEHGLEYLCLKENVLCQDSINSK